MKITNLPQCVQNLVGKPSTNGGRGSILRSALLLGLLGAGFLLASGCSSNKADLPNAWSSLPAGTQPYRTTRLQAGDVVRVNFEGSTNLNTIAKIQLDGTVSMPFVGSVKFAEKTAPEVQAELLKLYEPQLKITEITVSLLTPASCIYVNGAVLRAGKLPYDRSMTVLEAVMEAGGYDPKRAKLKEVMIFRVENGVQMSYKLDLKRMLAGGDSGVFHLQPFDIIYIPEKTFNF